MTTFTRFSEQRRELIAKMKKTIKAKSHKGGGLTHYHFILYAALRGQDIRKTSHQPDGDNARERLADLMDRLDQSHGWYNLYPFSRILDENGEFFFEGQYTVTMKELLEAAQKQLEAPMKQAS